MVNRVVGRACEEAIVGPGGAWERPPYRRSPQVTIHVALLRAVNVGGRVLVMADLAAMLADIGLASARTLLQSGNVVFDSAGRSGAALETFLEKETAKRLKLETHFQVRTAAEWTSIIAANPFPREAQDDP